MLIWIEVILDSHLDSALGSPYSPIDVHTRSLSQNASCLNKVRVHSRVIRGGRRWYKKVALLLLVFAMQKLGKPMTEYNDAMASSSFGVEGLEEVKYNFGVILSPFWGLNNVNLIHKCENNHGMLSRREDWEFRSCNTLSSISRIINSFIPVGLET